MPADLSSRKHISSSIFPIFSPYISSSEKRECIKLVEHLNHLDHEVNDKIELLALKMAELQGVTEKLKEENQMLQVAKMNNINNVAEEILLLGIVYC